MTFRNLIWLASWIVRKVTCGECFMVGMRRPLIGYFVHGVM